jgi:surface carbohydrate biosynthesis protein (TIGR04326 family)
VQNPEPTPLLENTLVIWDQQKLPEVISKDVLLWQSYDSQENFLSIPNYLEKHAKRFKVKYLQFIHELGESKLKGKRIVDHLDIGEGFSIWWMTLLAEKSPFKSTTIYDCLRLMALEEILKDKALPKVKLFSDDKNLRLALHKICENLQIKFLWETLSQKKNIRWSVKRIFHALPHELQAIIFLVRHVTLRWPLQKLDIPQWHTGSSVFFFVLILSTWIPSTVIKDGFIQGSGNHCLS